MKKPSDRELLDPLPDIHAMAIKKAGELTAFCRDNNLEYLFCLRTASDINVPRGISSYSAGKDVHTFWSLVCGMIEQISQNTLTIRPINESNNSGEEWKQQ